MSTPSEFEFKPTPGKWEHRGITVREIRRIFDELGDDYVIDAMVIPHEGNSTSGKLMAIYPCVHPRTDEDTSNLLILENAKEVIESLMEFGDRLGWGDAIVDETEEDAL